MIVAAGQSNPAGIALDGKNVYWTNASQTGSVMAAPKAGGAPVTLVPAQSSPGGIAVDTTSVYWTTAGGVMRASLSTAAPPRTSRRSPGPTAIAIDRASVYWTNYESADAAGGGVMKVPIQGGEAVTLAAEQNYPQAIAVLTKRRLTG